MGFNDPFFSNGISLITTYCVQIGDFFKKYYDYRDTTKRNAFRNILNTNLDSLGYKIYKGIKHNDNLLKSLYNNFDNWTEFCKSLIIWQYGTTLLELSNEFDNFDFFGSGDDFFKKMCKDIAKNKKINNDQLDFLKKYKNQGVIGELDYDVFKEIEKKTPLLYGFKADMCSYEKFFRKSNFDYKLKRIIINLFRFTLEYKK